MYNIVPFVLQNRWYRVEITDPLSADILDLDVISDNFQPSVPTIIDHIWGFFTGNIIKLVIRLVLIFIMQYRILCILLLKICMYVLRMHEILKLEFII